MYNLHFDSVRHQKVVDSIEILRVEEADFDPASAVCRLKDFHLCAECSSQLRLRSFDVRVNGLRRRASGRFLLARLLNQLLCCSYGQSAIDDLPGESPL